MHEECTTLLELLRWRARAQPEQLAYRFLIDGETKEDCLTYRDLDRRARSIAAQLQVASCADKRALLLYPPGLDYIAAFFGCLYAKVIAVPAYPPYSAKSMPRTRAIMEDAQVAVILTTQQLLAEVKEKLGYAQVTGAPRLFATDVAVQGAEEDWQAPAIDAATLAMFQYTSGSTASPKGVMLSHSNLLHNSALIHQGFENTPASRGVIWLPPYHDMGLIGGIIQPLYMGHPVTLMSPLSFLQKPFRWLQAISRTRATHSGGPNFAYELCVRKVTPEQRAQLNLASWQLAFNGAEPIRPETMERFAAAFAPCGFRLEALYPCYGLAEATLMVSGGKKALAPAIQAFSGPHLANKQAVIQTAQAEDIRLLVSCGRVLADQRVEIVDPDTMTPCPPGHVGEIWVAGASVAQGYWNKPEATNTSFAAYLTASGEGPFLRTGDLGFFHQGELFCTGRLKDLIIIRGTNYYPQDLELTAEQSHSALREGGGAAFTVEHNGEDQLIIVHEIERNYRFLATQEVIDAVRQAIAEQYGVQVHVVVLLKYGSLPRTSSGKVQRYICRVNYLANNLELWQTREQLA